MHVVTERNIDMGTENKSVDERLDDCQTLSDIHDTFTLRELVILTKDGLLEKWLNDNFLEYQAQILSNARGKSRDAVLMALCEVLDVDVTKISDYDAGEVISAIEREREKSKRERECGKDGIIVTNQRDLVEALANEDTKKIYLYNEIFSIPLNRGHITYDGRGNALINILAQGDTILNFDRNEVYFYNLTIVFHFLDPDQVKIDHSSQNHNKIIFLREKRISQDDSVRHHEMADFLAGRKPFESVQLFAERAERFHGIIIGKTYLNSTDYDFWHGAFFIKPIWRAEFIDCLRRYVWGAGLAFSINCEEANELFEYERAQLIYADFGIDRDNAVITRLYIHSNGGKGKSYTLHRWCCTTSWAFGSGSGDAGYGLDLIAVDDDNRKSSNIVSFD